MKFILSFVECLSGLFFIGVIIWVLTRPMSSLQASDNFEQPFYFWPYFIISLVFLSVGIFGVILIIDAIKRGNR